MANVTAAQTSCTEEDHTNDECCENIPPGVITVPGTPKLKVQVKDVVGYSSKQQRGEKEPLSDNCNFSIPPPKDSNIKASSPETLTRGNNSHLTVSSLSFSNIMANCQKPTGSSSQRSVADFTSSHSGRSVEFTSASVSWLADENMPEITLLDATCDTTMELTEDNLALPGSMPSTPVTAGSVHAFISPLPSTNLKATPKRCPQKQASDLVPFDKPSLQKATTLREARAKACNAQGNHSQVDPAEVSKHTGTMASKDPDAKMADVPESIDAPLRWLDDRYFPEITLLDVTCDSMFSPKTSSLATQGIPSVDSLQNAVPSPAQREQVVVEPGTSDVVQSDLSSKLNDNVSHTASTGSGKNVCENLPEASLEVTRDISMGSSLEDSQPSLVPNDQNMKAQTSLQDVKSTHPVNVTHDMGSSSEMSVSCVASLSSASDTQCNSSKNVTFEPHGEPAETSHSVNASSEELHTSHDAKLTRQLPQPHPKTSGSANGTFTAVEQFADLSTSTHANTTTETQCPQNKTIEPPESDLKSPEVQREGKDEPTSVCKTTAETTSINHSVSSEKQSASCDEQNVTFDRHSLQKSTGSTMLGEAGGATFSLENNTFNIKSSLQNGTITISNTSSSDRQQSPSDKPSLPTVCNSTSSPKDNNSEVQPTKMPESNQTSAGADSAAKAICSREGTFETNPTVEVVSGAAQCETKDHSQSGLSDTLGQQSVDTEANNGNTFNLDDTLDLKAESLVTSTPMVNSKMFNFHMEREEGQTIGAQKKLYVDTATKLDAQVSSDIPSNIICDRKTFLTQPAAKSMLPPLKAASQLLKNRAASALPGRLEPFKSCLPVTRQRTQAERNSAAADASEVVGL